ncbi:MAG: hypothetical protein QXD48_02610 [Candidatus Aenigmatarchaeota archaeon]
MDSTLEKRFSEIEESVRTIAIFVKNEKEKMKKYIEEKMNQEELKKSIYTEFDKKLISLEKKFNEEFSKLEEIIHESGKTLTEKGMEQYLNKINAMRNDLNLALEKIESIKTKFTEKDIETIQNNIKNLNDKIISINKKIEERMRSDNRFELIDEKIKKMEQQLKMFEISTNETRSNYLKKIDDDINNLKNIIDNEEKIRNTINKNIKDLDQRLKTLEMTRIEEPNKLNNEIEDLRKLIDRVTTANASINKHLVELEHELSEIKSKKDERLEMNVSGVVNKLVAKNLEEFMKVLDRKIPHIMTREEYMRYISDLNKRIENIRSPDLSDLIKRIEIIEQNLNEISKMILSIYNRIPVIVE